MGITGREQIQRVMDASEQFACWNDPVGLGNAIAPLNWTLPSIEHRT
jgi:hypothetical protein